MKIIEEYDNKTTSNGASRAVAGGLLFGTVGAVVGAAGARQVQVSKLTKLKFEFRKRGASRFSEPITIDLLNEYNQITGIDVRKLQYQEVMNMAQSIMNWYNTYANI